MDVEKTMQFLLEQQARFDARQAEIVARQAEFAAEFAEQQGQSHERMTRVESVMLDVATAHKRTNAILATLTERHVELAQSHKELSAAQKSAEQRLETVFEAQKATEQSLKSVFEAQRVTEQNLNALISVVERHIADHK